MGRSNIFERKSKQNLIDYSFDFLACEPKALSFQCMTKFTTNKKKLIKK